MTKNVKVTHLRSRLSLEVDWVWGKPKSLEHPKDLESGPHPIIRNIHQTAPYSSSRLENYCILREIVFPIDFKKSKTLKFENIKKEIDKLYLEVNNDEVEVGRSRLGFGFRSVSTLNEKPVYIYIYIYYV